MNFIDIFVIAVIGLFGAAGFIKGFIPQLFQAAGLICAFVFNTPVSKIIADIISQENEGITMVITGIVSFLLIYSVFFISGLIISKAVDLTLTSLPNRTAGIIFGCIKGFFIITFIMLIIRLFPGGDSFLQRYVTPDGDTDKAIYKTMELARKNISDPGFKENIEKMQDSIEDEIISEKTSGPYSRIGYGAYRISTLMDPYVVNFKNIVSSGKKEIELEKIKEKIQNKTEDI